MKKPAIKTNCSYCGADLIRYGKLRIYSCDRCKMLMNRWTSEDIKHRLYIIEEWLKIKNNEKDNNIKR